jgi:hypothetical protein
MLTVPGMVKAYGYEVPSMTASHVSIGTGFGTASQVPVMTLINAGNPVDQRMWIIAALSDRLYFSSEKDDGTDNPWMQAMRGTGNAVSSVIITPPLSVTGGVTSQGSPVRTFANTPTGGGGVNPGTANVLSFYPAAGSTVSPSQITTDAATQMTLTVPTSLSTNLISAGQVYTNNDQRGNFNDRNSSNWEYIQESTSTMVAGAGHNVSGEWAGTYNGYDGAYSAQRGIAQLRSGFLERFAVGDTAGLYYYVRSVGGVACGSDEGCTAASLSCYEYDQGYFHGTVNTTTGLGDQAPTWTPTSGKDMTIDGAFMLNISKGQLQGNWNGTSSPPSTQLVLTTAAGTNPGTQYTFLSQLPTTAISFPAGSVQPWSAAITYGAGNIVSLSGTNYVSLRGRTGYGATITLGVDGTGKVITATPGAVGTGYATATVTLSGGGGSGAQITPVIVSGQITSYNVVSGGTGYTTAPTGIVVSGGNLGNNPPTTLATWWEVLPAGQLPISTAIGIVDAVSLPIPDPNVAPNAPVDRTLTVNLAQLRGTYPPFAVNDVVTLAGNGVVEQTKIEVATMIGTQQQSLTMKLRNANGQAILFRGGLQGMYISMDANLPFSGMRSSYYCLGSLDGINLIYAVTVAGGTGVVQLPQLGCEPATASGTGSGFHLYPGGEIVCNPTYGHTGTLEVNGVRWEPGDNVENPHYPVYGGSALFVNKQQITPANAGFGSQGFFMLVGGKGFCGGGAVAMWIRSNEPDTNFYAAGQVGSSVQAPGGITLQGFYNHGLFLSNAPQPTGGACLAIGAPADPMNKNNNQMAVVKIIDVQYSTPGKLSYDPAAGQWDCSGSFYASGGNIAAGGGLSCGGGANFLSGAFVFSGNNDQAVISFPGSFGRPTQSITASYLYSAMLYDTMNGGTHIFRVADGGGTPQNMAWIGAAGLYSPALTLTGTAATGKATAPGGFFANTATFQGAATTNAMFQQNSYYDGGGDHFLDSTKVAARVMLSGETLLFQISPAGSAPVWQTLFSIDATGNVKSLGTMTPSTTP